MSDEPSISVHDVETFLGLGVGAFDHIPKYCKKEALEAIAHVRKLERESLLRPGVYYVALSDLSGATESSKTLGAELNKRRVESFITACVGSLGLSEPASYAQFVKSVGDAGLFLFSAFTDLHHWWTVLQSQMRLYSFEWGKDQDSAVSAVFALRAKTVFHVGEVTYSGGNDPMSAAVNDVFKIEKQFQSGELGCTDLARIVAAPFFPDLGLTPELRGEVDLPGAAAAVKTWVVAADRVSV